MKSVLFTYIYVVTFTEMDEVIGDSHLIVLKHETEIMYQIVDYIRDHVTSITTMLDKIKMLDW